MAVSGLEMAQNSQRMAWTSEEVDSKLKLIMENCFKNGLETAKKYVEPAEGEFPSLVAGSNIAGFSKVAAAMKTQGDWWWAEMSRRNVRFAWGKESKDGMDVLVVLFFGGGCTNGVELSRRL